MSKAQRIKNIVIGFFLILSSIILITGGESAFRFIVFILSLSLVLRGIRTLLYYFMMARHMVGGKIMLIKGIIIFDIGMLTQTMMDVPLQVMVLYILGCHAVAGIVDILRAREAKIMQAGSWKLNMSYGITNILIAAITFVCGIVFQSIDIVLYIYCIGLCYSSVIRIIRAFRKTAMVYIP